MPLTRVVYIETADFRVEDAKDYYGLAPGKSAMLRWGVSPLYRSLPVCNKTNHAWAGDRFGMTDDLTCRHRVLLFSLP